MKSTKEHDKRDGKKPQRKTNGDDLRRALNWIVIDDIFAHVRLHGNVKWKPLALVLPSVPDGGGFAQGVAKNAAHRVFKNIQGRHRG